MLAGILSTLQLVPKYSAVSSFHELPAAVNQDADNQNSGEYENGDLFHGSAQSSILSPFYARQIKASIFQWTAISLLIGFQIGQADSISKTQESHGYAIICADSAEPVCRTGLFEAQQQVDGHQVTPLPFSDGW